MNIELIFLFTSLALFAYWLNFVMGGPLADAQKVDPDAMLFFIPFKLAAIRLKNKGLLTDIVAEQMDEIKLSRDPFVWTKLVSDHRLAIYLKGRELFTWEKALLCPVCFHWWITLIVGFMLFIFDGFNIRTDFLFAAFLYLVNHLLIRKIS